MMRKMRLVGRLKFIVPTLQVLLLISASLWQRILENRYAEHPEAIVGYILTPKNILLKANFPLAVLWFPMFRALEWALSSSNQSLARGAAGVTTLAVLDVAVFSTIALFWYFVVVEIELRKRKASHIRFSGQRLEKLKATVMMLVGLGVAVFAFWDGHRLVVLDQLNLHRFFWSSVVADALIGGLFLVAWGAAFIAMGVQDIVRVSGLKANTAAGQHG